MASVPWHVVENENNIDDAVITWNKLFSEIADAPEAIKKRRLKGVVVPWMNDKIRAAIRDRDYHHRKAVKGTVSRLCARASVICFFLQKTIELSY